MSAGGRREAVLVRDLALDAAADAVGPDLAFDLGQILAQEVGALRQQGIPPSYEVRGHLNPVAGPDAPVVEPDRERVRAFLDLLLARMRRRIDTEVTRRLGALRSEVEQLESDWLDTGAGDEVVERLGAALAHGKEAR